MTTGKSQIAVTIRLTTYALYFVGTVEATSASERIIVLRYAERCSCLVRQNEANLDATEEAAGNSLVIDEGFARPDGKLIGACNLDVVTDIALVNRPLCLMVELVFGQNRKG